MHDQGLGEFVDKKATIDLMQRINTLNEMRLYG